MDLFIAFAVFVASLIAGMVFGFNMVIALAVGLICFIVVGLRRGFELRDLMGMALRGSRKSLGILRIFVLLGMITGLWRAAGIIAFFVNAGLQIITPKMFILVAYLIACVIGFALGTSFGVISTVGVVFMAIARSCGVDPLIVAGALLAAAYFGERATPTSSSTHLVTMVTGTKLIDNIKQLHKTGFLPFLISVVICTVVSVNNPLVQADPGLLSEMTGTFNLTPWLAVPAVLLIILPLVFKIDVMYAMIISIFVTFGLAFGVQHVGIVEALKISMLGYHPPGGSAMAVVFAGGGILSMATVSGIVILSTSFSGLFEGTRMLDGIQEQISKLSDKIGLFPVMILVSFATSGVLCSQTIGIIMNEQLMGPVYERSGASKKELMTDIGSSTTTIAAMLPWVPACSVPLEAMGVGAGAVLHAYFLYLLPLIYLLTKKFFFKPRAKAAEHT